MAVVKAKSRMRIEKNKIRRKGIHAKTKQSKNKGSKNYVKVYRGQGR